MAQLVERPASARSDLAAHGFEPGVGICGDVLCISYGALFLVVSPTIRAYAYASAMVAEVVSSRGPWSLGSLFGLSGQSVTG